LIVGPNGAGKSSLFAFVLAPITFVPFVNADLIALEEWPEDTAAHSYEAARIASSQRDALIASGQSFATETVFSHISKLDILRNARAAGYFISLHVVAIPEELAVARVSDRVHNGGHYVPEDKIRTRFHRLWPLVGEAIKLADRTVLYDNSESRTPFRIFAKYESDRLRQSIGWPDWFTYLS